MHSLFVWSMRLSDHALELVRVGRGDVDIVACRLEVAAKGPVKEGLVVVRHSSCGSGLGASDGALLRGRRGYCEDERFCRGRVCLGREAGSSGEQDVVVLNLGLLRHRKVKGVFYLVLAKKIRLRNHQSRTNIGPGVCYGWNWSRRARSARIEVIRRKAQLKLFPLRHRNRNLLDLQENRLICGVGLWLHADLGTIRGPVCLLDIDSSLLVGGFATSLKLIIDMVRNLVEQGDPSWRIWGAKKNQYKAVTACSGVLFTCCPLDAL